MASLLDRLVGDAPSNEKISVHAFTAAMAELRRGEVTTNQFMGAFEISTNEMLAIFSVAQSGLGNREIEDILILGEESVPSSTVGAHYYTKTRVKNRLGL